MSVVVSKRKVGDLVVFTKIDELINEIQKLVTNKKYFPLSTAIKSGKNKKNNIIVPVLAKNI